MSDTTETPEDKKKKRTPVAETLAGADVEATPKRQDFFDWLESLFFGAQNFPEKLKVHVVRGKDHATVGPLIQIKSWGASDKRPTKVELIMLSNWFLSLIQRDCDQQRRQVVYAVLASHFAREDEFYARFLIRCIPGPLFKDGDNPEHEEGDENGEKRFSGQIMKHQESMVSMLGAGFEGQLDRQDRFIDRLIKRNEFLEKKIDELNDQLQRAMSLEMERADQRAWSAIKVKGAEQALALGMGFAPQLLGKLTGQQQHTNGVISETGETMTIKNFLKTKEEGGLATQEQLNAALGTYGPAPDHVHIKDGVLSLEQAQLLYDVAHCRVPANDLDKFLIPGPLAIRPEQLVALQQIFDFSQMLPLQGIFKSRYEALVKAQEAAEAKKL